MLKLPHSMGISSWCNSDCAVVRRRLPWLRRWLPSGHVCTVNAGNSCWHRNQKTAAMPVRSTIRLRRQAKPLTLSFSAVHRQALCLGCPVHEPLRELICLVKARGHNLRGCLLLLQCSSAVGTCHQRPHVSGCVAAVPCHSLLSQMRWSHNCPWSMPEGFWLLLLKGVVPALELPAQKMNMSW